MEDYSLYEDLLDIDNLKIDKVEKLETKLKIHCHIETEKENCPNCQNPCTITKQRTRTELRDLSISEREVWLHLSKRQFICEECDRNFTERLSWVEPNKSYTKRYSKFVFKLCRSQSFQEVGAIVNTSSKTVERMYYGRAQRVLNVQGKWKKVSHLGIDEISNKKGRGNYCCVLTNLETGEEIDILPDRKKATITAYFDELGTEICSQIEVVCFDMWDAYLTASKVLFPNALLIVDRFHVVKSLNKSLDFLRREERKKNPNENALKGIKWLLYKRLEKCSLAEVEKLEAAFEKSADLQQAYILREAFNSYFDLAPNKLWLENQLEHWQQEIKSSNLTCFDKFLRTLKNWKSEVTNFALRRVTNAATEGLNNIIRQVKRFSFGMYNFEHLRLRVLARYSY